MARSRHGHAASAGSRHGACPAARRDRRCSARARSAARRPRPARSIGRTIWRCCRRFPRSCRRCSSGANNATSGHDDQARDAEGFRARQQCAATGPHIARLARSSGGARAPGGDQAERQSALRACGLCQAARRSARHGVPAAGRPSDAGGVRPRFRSRLDGRGDGRRAGRGAHALSGGGAQSDPVAGGEVRAGAGGGASPGRSGAATAAADPQRARRRALHQRRPDDRSQSEDRKAERLDPPLPAHRARTGSACCCCRATPTCSSTWPSRAASRSTPPSWSASIR